MPDAPSDGTAYVRKDAAWVAEQDPGIHDAPSDGTSYVRKNAAWVAEASGGGSGDVVGPASAVSGHLAVFDGTTGKLLKDGGPVPSGSGGSMPGASYAERLCALLEPDAIEQIQMGAFTYPATTNVKYILASWKTRLGATGRAEVRNPQVPMPLKNLVFSGTGTDSAAIILDPSIPTYADAWTTYYARKLSIDSL